MEPIIERRLRSLRAGLWFMAGLTLALGATFLAGDLGFSGPEVAFPYGWVVLWLVSLIGCPPLGIVLLVGPAWRSLPLQRRRGTALGFLVIALVDLVFVSIRSTIEGTGPGLWFVALAYALILLLAVISTQPQRARQGDDLFP
jgi:hypothetical protein